MRVLLFLSLIFFLASCGGNGEQTSASNQTETISNNELDRLPQSDLAVLFEKCEAIEITFYDLPVSMATNKDNTRGFLGFITQTPVYETELVKKAIGVMAFNVDGDIYIEGEFYMDPNNTFKPYFRFSKGSGANKVYYYNKMSDQGYDILTRPFKQGAPK